MPSMRKELEKTAKLQAEVRGHTLSNFATGYGAAKTWSEAYCLNCSMVVAVDSKPPNHRPRIGGVALSFDCPSKAELRTESP